MDRYKAKAERSSKTKLSKGLYTGKLYFATPWAQGTPMKSRPLQDGAQTLKQHNMQREVIRIGYVLPTASAVKCSAA